MLTFELYPWHSKKVQGSRMRPPADVIRSFVWEPKDWFERLEDLGLRPSLHLGHGGDPYPTLTKPRAYSTVKVYEGLQGGVVVAISTAAAAAPPKTAETLVLRDELGRRGFRVPG